MTATIPEREQHCGSWFIVRDGKAIAETFDRHTAEQCARYGYQVFTAAQWLGKLNKEAKR